jgi:phosphatidylinositol-3-phosphatase
MITRRLALGLVAGTALAGSASAGPIEDVFVISMENHNFVQPSTQTSPDQIFGNPAAPFQTSLITPGDPNAANVSWASNYYNVLANTANNQHIHPSEPNYIWANGGSNFGVLNDADPGKEPVNSPTNLITAQSLTGLMQDKGISWKSYQEDIELPVAGKNVPGTVPLASFSGSSTTYTNPYNGSNQFNYAAKHNPQVFFTDSNAPGNAANYAPLTQLQNDLKNNTVARYNWIAPDQYNDAHSTLNGGFTYKGVHYTGDQARIAQGDNFLSIIVPQIEASKAFKNNGAIVIWWDETEGGDDLTHTLEEIVISPDAKGNAYVSTLPYTHSSDLLTWEENFHLGTCLGDSCTKGMNNLSDLFVPGTIASGVPELSTWAMMLVGFGFVGLRLRRMAPATA